LQEEGYISRADLNNTFVDALFNTLSRAVQPGGAADVGINVILLYL
jgi:hypothetical protein